MSSYVLLKQGDPTVIIDTLKNASHYHGVSKGIEAGLKFLASTDFDKVELGRHELDNGLYCMVMRYDTKPAEEVRYEAHRKYIDIQLCLDGAEKIEYAEISALTPSTEYDAEGDAQFLAGEGDWVTLGKGVFAIFMPQDAHRPSVNACCCSKPVFKAVVKVPVGS